MDSLSLTIIIVGQKERDPQDKNSSSHPAEKLAHNLIIELRIHSQSRNRDEYASINPLILKINPEEFSLKTSRSWTSHELYSSPIKSNKVKQQKLQVKEKLSPLIVKWKNKRRMTRRLLNRSRIIPHLKQSPC